MSEETVVICEEVGIPNCKHSPQIDKIAAALVAALPKIEQAVKDAENPHLRNKYADLTSIMGVAKKPLADHGIAIMQPITTEGQKATVTTLLLHTSGQWMASTLSMTATDQKPQSVGSAMTYGRRYGLSGFLGIVADDDDGNDASGTKGPRKGRDSEPDPPGVQRNTPEQQAEYSKKRAEEVKQQAAAKTTSKTGGISYSKLPLFQKKKEEIGEAWYRRILGMAKVQKSNEIPDDKTADTLLAEMEATLKMLNGFAEIGEYIGQAEFMRVMGANGYGHVGEIHDLATARRIYKEMAEVKKEKDMRRDDPATAAQLFDKGKPSASLRDPQ